MARPSPSSAAAARKRSSTEVDEEGRVPFEAVLGVEAEAVFFGVVLVLGETAPFDALAFLFEVALSWPRTL